ncbi:MAG: thiolase C-terminal domain-containing protein [Dehalococcoidia bacterium]
MERRVAIVGVGATPFHPLSPDLSYRELVYEAAVRAYQDAGIDPREDVDSFISVAEDYDEGTAIFDEYTPDQVGAALRPMHTISADGLYGVAAAFMLIQTGQCEVVVVEGHSKASNILTPSYITALAMDPIYNRPLRFHPTCIAGMEMARYLQETGTTPTQCCAVAVKNRRNALLNPLAAYGANLSLEEAQASPIAFAPLREVEMSRSADGAVVLVLASEEAARHLMGHPIWVHGVGWCSDSPTLETREWGDAVYAHLAAQMAYRQAGIRNPARQLHLAEVDDTYAYKELMHIEALGLCRRGEAGRLVEEGATERDGHMPVNVSGGSLGMGHLGEATGLARLAQAVLQLRGRGETRQVKGAKTAIVQSWRGVPSASGAVVILSA